MIIKKWTNKMLNKHIKVKWNKLVKNGGDNMEMVKRNVKEVIFKKANTKDVLMAIKKGNKKYAKAMKELAK